MADIGIVGTGISGVQLTLFLQQAGIDTVLYAERTPEEIRSSKLANTVVRFAQTRDRERSVGVDSWDFLDDGWGMTCADLWIKGRPPLTLHGDLDRPASVVDFRIYCSELIETYEKRGGTVVFGPVTVEQLSGYSEAHALTVVATGARALTALFPRLPDRSPYEVPQRLLMAGLFHGIEQTNPVGLSFNISPDAGEIFQAAYYSFDGRVANMLFEAVPGGPLAAAATDDYSADSRAFEGMLLEMLAEHAPAIRERVVTNEFALTRPLDLLQGSITPTARRGYTKLASGRFAVAVGDTWVQNDPINGQGANMGSYCARVMADAIAGSSVYDEAFCARVEDEMWEYGSAVTQWSNAALQPPPPHLIGVFVAAAQNKQVADALVNGFTDPRTQWSRLASPAAAEAFVASYGMALPQVPGA